jgi:DNA replication protein DnaC
MNTIASLIPTETLMTLERLRERLARLSLHGLLARAETVMNEPWLKNLLDLEEAERARRSLKRRLDDAKLGTFKPMADFEWDWPTQCDRELIEELFQLHFIEECANVLLIGPNGLGKTMILKNLLHVAVLRGYTARFVSAGDMLADLAKQDSSNALSRRLRRYTAPDILAVDEVGYLSYDTRYADLFFEVVTRRYHERPIALSTNKPFGQWSEVFPNAACVVTLVDRLVHKAEITTLDGKSYRLKEAEERAARKAAERAARKAQRAAAEAAPD